MRPKTGGNPDEEIGLSSGTPRRYCVTRVYAISQEQLAFALIMDGALLPGVHAIVAMSTTNPNVVMPHGDLGGSLTDFPFLL